MPSGSSCDDNRPATHLAGGVMIGVGAAATVVGVPLAIWGASRESPAADVRLGLGSVAARYRF